MPGSQSSSRALDRGGEERRSAPNLPPVYRGFDGRRPGSFRRKSPYKPADPGGPVRILPAAGYTPGKRHDLLIRAVGQLRSDGIDARLAIAGEDADSGTGQFRRELEVTVAESASRMRSDFPCAVRGGRSPQAGSRARVRPVKRHRGIAHRSRRGDGDGRARRSRLTSAERQNSCTMARMDSRSQRATRPRSPRRFARSPPTRSWHYDSAGGRATVEAGFGSERSAATIVAVLKRHAGP